MVPASPVAPRTRVGISRTILGAALLAAAFFLSGCTEPPKPETFWSPDGTTIAYVDHNSLSLYDVSAGTSKKLPTGAGWVASASWSPDGKVIAFYSLSEDEDPMSVPISVNAVSPATGQVEVLQAQRWPKPDAESAAPRSLPEATIRVAALVYGQPASWSPDGRRLACVGPDPAGTAISLLSYPSGAAARIAQTTAIIGWLAWSPDGNKIAYVSFPKPEPEHSWASSLWVHDLATSTTTKIADLEDGSPVEGTRIVWSADSTRIGFIGRGPGRTVTSPEGQGVADIHYPGTESACLVDARPGATVTTELADITQTEDAMQIPDTVAPVAWAPGLSGVVFTESKWDGSTYEGPVLVYRGLQQSGRTALGPVPSGASTPQFSADGRQVSVAVKRLRDPSKVFVFAVP